jgi:hypothetical protein
VDEEARRHRFRSQFLTGRNPEEQTAAVRGFLALAHEGFVEYVEDLLTISRRRDRDAANLYRLQVSMLQNIVPLQTRLAIAKRPMPAESSRHATEESSSERDVHAIALERFIAAIRAVGDGIVWRLLGHDRATYRLLALGGASGFMEADGLKQELVALMGQVGRESGVPILAALTNVVRFGDLVVFSDRNEEESEITLVEVKTANGRSPRVRRQKRNLSTLVSILDTGEGVVEKSQVRIQAVHTPQEHFLGAVLELIHLARREGSAGRTLDACLHVECHSLGNISAVATKRVTAESEGIASRWENAGDLVVPISSLDSIQFSPNAAPYSVFPFSDRICAEILTNQLVIRSFLNVTALLREYQRAGWTVEEDVSATIGKAIDENEDPRGTAFGVISRGHCTLRLPPSVGARVGLEFVRPRTFVREANEALNAGPGGWEGGMLAFYPQERKTWK